jgi:hypothetical protein
MVSMVVCTCTYTYTCTRTQTHILQAQIKKAFDLSNFIVMVTHTCTRTQTHILQAQIKKAFDLSNFIVMVLKRSLEASKASLDIFRDCPAFMTNLKENPESHHLIVLHYLENSGEFREREHAAILKGNKYACMYACMHACMYVCMYRETMQPF